MAGLALTKRLNAERRGAIVRRWAGDRRPMLVDVSLAFLLSRLIFYAAALVALWALPEYHAGAYVPWHTPSPALIDASWRWDAGWYGTIIAHGYRLVPGQNNVAFFPLYPLLVRLALLPFSLKWMYLAGVLVNHLAFLAALVAIWSYVERTGGRGLARRTLYLLAIFPGSFFFAAAYSESVFLLTAAGVFLALQRGRYGLAGGCALLASLTRPPGILLALPIAVELWRRHRAGISELARRGTALLLVPLGPLLLMSYFWWRFGQPLVFLSAQGSWTRTRATPWWTLTKSLDLIESGGGWNLQLMVVVNTAAVLLALVLGLALLGREPAAAVFVLASIAVPLAFPPSTNPSTSLARFVVVLFPLFVQLARWARQRLTLALLTAVFLPTNFLLAALFVRWYWVV
ncbi:MAG TPA: mannosyltransferase family protein [Thermomicrobiaceae bacterium]|nr:mannosyltransferase family protein [Thermomicrobiaceae bacterium]